MKKLFVHYGIAKQLEEKGFNEECFGCYENETLYFTGGMYKQRNLTLETLAPLYQQVIDWFREKHKISIWIVPFSDKYQAQIETPYKLKQDIENQNYYEALDEAIIEALKLI